VAAQQGYLALFIDFFFETPLRRDLDGGLKIALDAICTALGVNDNRVVDIHLVKRFSCHLQASPLVVTPISAYSSSTAPPESYSPDTSYTYPRGRLKLNSELLGRDQT
jgi:hypothetical protein